MTVSGNVSSRTFETARASLPGHQVNVMPVPLDTDDAIWPGGLILGKLENGNYTPYATLTEQIGTGDGTEKTFTADVGPIEPGTVEITAGAVTLADDGCGNLTGTGGSGAYNQETGKIVASFSAAPAEGAAVNLSHKPDPCAVLDSQTDTARSSSALAAKFGAVRKSELKVGVTTPDAPSAAVLNRLEIRNIHPV